MIFVETTSFTKRITKLLTAEEYREFQITLLENPELGAVIPGSGGLRKVRISAKGHGKRGGARVIYYWANSYDRILMLYVYPKAETEDLTTEQIKVLKKLVKSEYP